MLEYDYKPLVIGLSSSVIRLSSVNQTLTVSSEIPTPAYEYVVPISCMSRLNSSYLHVYKPVYEMLHWQLHRSAGLFSTLAIAGCLLYKSNQCKAHVSHYT